MEDTCLHTSASIFSKSFSAFVRAASISSKLLMRSFSIMGFPLERSELRNSYSGLKSALLANSFEDRCLHSYPASPCLHFWTHLFSRALQFCCISTAGHCISTADMLEQPR